MALIMTKMNTLLKKAVISHTGLRSLENLEKEVLAKFSDAMTTSSKSMLVLKFSETKKDCTSKV